MGSVRQEEVARTSHFRSKHTPPNHTKKDRPPRFARTVRAVNLCVAAACREAIFGFAEEGRVYLYFR
jgi:hypothetical protein